MTTKLIRSPGCLPEKVDWTPEDVERLRTMWIEGASAPEIAKALGRTRNSILGRIFRMRDREGAERWPVRAPAGAIAAMQERKRRLEEVRAQRKAQLEAEQAARKRANLTRLEAREVAQVVGLDADPPAPERPADGQAGSAPPHASAPQRLPASAPRSAPVRMTARDAHVRADALIPVARERERAIPLWELRARECRWPVEEDGQGRHLFCAEEVVDGYCYCAKHVLSSVGEKWWREHRREHKRILAAAGVPDLPAAAE